MNKQAMSQAMMALEHAKDWLDTNQSAYDEAESAIEALRAALDAPSLSDAQIDAVTYRKWGTQLEMQHISHRAYARMIEQEVRGKA